MVVVVLAVVLLVPVLACEARDWLRGASVGGLWVFLALGALATAFALNA